MCVACPGVSDTMYTDLASRVGAEVVEGTGPLQNLMSLWDASHREGLHLNLLI